MKNRISTEQQVETLTNFLKNVTKNDKLFIYSVNLGKNKKFAIAQNINGSAIDVKSNFMNYEEMNCFFMGILTVKENRINF